MINEVDFIADLLTKSQTIKVANGYLTDLGNAVADWDPGTLPKNSTLYARIEDTDAGFSYGKGVKETLTIEINIFCAAAANTAATIRKAVADYYKMLKDNKKFFSDKYGTVFLPIGHKKAVEKGDKTEGGALITINVQKESERWETI